MRTSEKCSIRNSPTGMDLTSKKTIIELLKKYSAAALKGLGQHFLIDKGTLRKIIEAAEIGLNDIVLEIGPGIGTLTQELAQKVKKVIAIEKDQKMCEVLKETLKDFKNVEIIHGDVLNTKYKIQNTKYKIVANLPYYITSPAIRKFLEIDTPPSEMILMVQKEVAQRICAMPPDMNLLAVSVQFYSEPEIISYVSKKSFWPEPKVDSAIIKLKIKNERSKIDKNLFFKIVKAGFSQPRKQLINNLSRLNFSSKNLSGQTKGLELSKEGARKWLLKNKIQPAQRAETLTIENWISLTKTF